MYLDTILSVIFNILMEGKLSFQLVTSQFIKWQKGMYKEVISSGKWLASGMNSSSEKHEQLPFGRIIRSWLSHECEEQTLWVVGADQLAVPGTRCEDSTYVTSLKAGVFEELSDTFCDETCGHTLVWVWVGTYLVR